ncbi:hypothetical protein Tco_1345816 [Tanacetum coccineum]
MEPEDSLIMGNEELSTIPEKESDEFIKSSIEDLVPIPSESEDTSESNKDIESKDSYVSNLDEPTLLVTPLSDANEDECFDPGGVIDEIDAFLDMDISMNIENGYHDSEGDIIYLESLLIDDTIPNLPPEVFLDHDPRSLKDEPDNDDLMTEDEVFDPGIWEIIFSQTYVRLPIYHFVDIPSGESKVKNDENEAKKKEGIIPSFSRQRHVVPRGLPRCLPRGATSDDTCLPEPKSSSSVEDDGINIDIVQDHNRSSSLLVNVLDEGCPKSVKEARGNPIEQFIVQIAFVLKRLFMADMHHKIWILERSRIRLHDLYKGS